MLPPNYRWEESENGAFLQWRYGCVAVVRVKREGERFCEVESRARKLIRSRAGSVEQGKRHIERWLAKQERFPPIGRK